MPGRMAGASSSAVIINTYFLRTARSGFVSPRSSTLPVFNMGVVRLKFWEGARQRSLQRSRSISSLKRVNISTTSLQEKDIIIAVLGPVGSGKSSFINMATDQPDHLRVGHQLSACTKVISASMKARCPELNSHNMILIDTPGFDGDHTEGEILKMIIAWLKKKHKHKSTLDGIIYLKKITDVPRLEVPYRCHPLLEQLCGRNHFQKVVLATTMWDVISDDDRGNNREQILKSMYWKNMAKSNSMVIRYTNSSTSAWEVLNPIISRVITVPTRRGTMSSPPSSPLREKTSFPLSLGLQPCEIESVSHGDIVIALIGPTGSGRSSFLKEATNFNVEIGNSLVKCTANICMIRAYFPEIGGSTVVLMDTPGIDEEYTWRDVFKLISRRLGSLKLSGILCLHRITDNRSAQIFSKHMPAFEELCGKDPYHKVVLTTTMWSENDKLESIQAEREGELKDKYWSNMLHRGSTMRRFMGTRESALDIIRPLVQSAQARYTA